MTVTIGRRELLAALGGAAAAWPLAVRAQLPILAAIDRGLRALSQWWSGRDNDRNRDGSSRSDHHAGGPAQAARGLRQPRQRREWRSGLVWTRFRRPVPPCRWLRRPHPQGRKA